MRLLGYIRVSTDDQAEHGHSLAVQEARLRAYCDAHEHELAGIFADEGVSAGVPLGARRAGRQLLAALLAGEADGVAVVRLDRMFRCALDGLSFFAKVARRQRVAVHSVSELIDTNTPAGKLNLTIQLATAEYERDLAAQRATDNSAGLRLAGRVYGHVPFGCTEVDGRLFRDPISWPHRKRIVGLRNSGYSLATIARVLRDECVLTPGGGRTWAKSTLSALCTTHLGLEHLPMLPVEAAPAPARAPETEVSTRAH